MTHATDDGQRPRLGASRGRVLAGLRDAAGGLGAVELAERLVLHPNSVRYHLDALTRAGLVDGRAHMTGRRGRPQLLYRAVAGPSADKRLYRTLTEAVTGNLAATEPDPHVAALNAGRTWGRLLAGPFRAGAVAALDTLAEILRGAGFRLRVVDESQRIDMHDCPVREIAREQGEVVCALHLGVVQGALAHLDAPVLAAPPGRSSPRRCVANGSSPDVYVCGPPAMVDAAAEVARVNGVDDEHPILERYLPTGA